MGLERMSFSCPDDMRNAMETIAKNEERPVSALIRIMLKEGLVKRLGDSIVQEKPKTVKKKKIRRRT